MTYDYPQLAADIINGLPDGTTPADARRALQDLDPLAQTAALAVTGGGGGGGGPLPDPITEIVNIDVADTADTWVLSTMAPDGGTSNLAFGNAVWDDTEPEGCGLIAAQENGDLQMSVKHSGRQLRLGNNQGGVVLLSLEPADAELGNNELCIWFDSTPGAAKMNIKARDETGTIVTATLALT